MHWGRPAATPPLGTEAGIAQKEGWHNWIVPWALESEGMGSSEQLLSSSVARARFSTCKAEPSDTGLL